MRPWVWRHQEPQGACSAVLKGGFREVNQGGAWTVKESYDVTAGVVRRLLDFAEPPGAVEGVVPDRGSDRQRGG